MFSSKKYQYVPEGGGRGRGRWRCRGRGDYSAVHQRTRSVPIATPTPPPPLGELLRTIQSQDLTPDYSQDGVAEITNVVDIASYNWLDASEPTILTPVISSAFIDSELCLLIVVGRPPRWKMPSSRQKLVRDNPSGTYYRDPNAAYSPLYPMEPVVRAVFEAIPEFESQEIDIFACGSTLGNLLRFVRNTDVEKPFRFLVEAVGQTVFLVRRENSPKETIPDVQGYGHAFPEANTTWDEDCKRSLTHQRIVRYQLGGLDIAIRFEADGYLPDHTSTPTEGPRNSTEDSGAEESMISALARNRIVKQEPTITSGLKVIRGRSSVAHSSIFDLKTRSIKKKSFDTTIEEQIPRLWIRQISHFVLAYHQFGVFETDEVAVHDLRPAIAQWEREHETDVRKLSALIKMIADATRSSTLQRLEIVYKPEFGMEIREQVEGLRSVLPQDLAARWADNCDETNRHAERGAILDGSIQSVDTNGEVTGSSTEVDPSERDEYEWDASEDYTACSEKCGYCGRCSY